MIRFFLFIAIFIFNFSLYASDEFASMETSSDFLIDGHVNVISGSFVDSEIDYEIPSIRPLSLKRSSVPYYKPPEHQSIWNAWLIDALVDWDLCEVVRD